MDLISGIRRVQHAWHVLWAPIEEVFHVSQYYANGYFLDGCQMSGWSVLVIGAIFCRYATGFDKK